MSSGWSLVDIVKYLAKRFDKIEQEIEIIKEEIKKGRSNDIIDGVLEKLDTPEREKLRDFINAKGK
jgi:hypothetical protein